MRDPTSPGGSRSASHFPLTNTRLRRLVASDFYGYYRPSECGLRVWLREQGVEEAPPSPYSEVLMRLGREHEERHLARFPTALDLSDGSLEERTERTREAIADGQRVIYQGALRTQTELGTSPSPGTQAGLRSC